MKKTFLLALLTAQDQPCLASGVVLEVS